MQEPGHKSSNGAINSSVTGAGIFASFVAPGAVFCAEKVAPHKMAWLKRQFAEHFVEPHLGAFHKLSTGLRHAHERYDARKREYLVAHGAPAPETGGNRDRKEEAYAIADAWVTGALAVGADTLANVGMLKLLNRIYGIGNKAMHVGAFDTAVSLLGMAAMPTLIPGIAENINHKISRVLRKFGLSKESAESISVPATYVQLPALGGLMASLMFAHKTNGVHK